MMYARKYLVCLAVACAYVFLQGGEVAAQDPPPPPPPPDVEFDDSYTGQPAGKGVSWVKVKVGWTNATQPNKKLRLKWYKVTNPGGLETLTLLINQTHPAPSDEDGKGQYTDSTGTNTGQPSGTVIRIVAILEDKDGNPIDQDISADYTIPN